MKSMKQVILALFLLFAGGISSAQAWGGEGDQKVQAGFSAWGYGTGITGSYDYGLGNIVSVGAGANIYFGNYRDNNKTNNFFIFGRAGFHLQEPLGLPSQWDVYPGINLGLIGSDFGIGAYIGARYFINDKIGIYAEVGNNGSLGVSINL